MEIKKYIVSGREVEFVNESRNTRHGFAHDTTLFVNGCKVSNDTCHYLNRTWENYRYQTVMKCAVSKHLDALKKELKTEYLAEHGYKKLTASRSEEFAKVLADNPEVLFYMEVYTTL